MAGGASRTRRSYYSAQHRRLASRRGARRATLAVAHSLLVTVHSLLSRQTSYVDLGADYFTGPRGPDQQAEKIIQKLKRLGYEVQVTRPEAA